MYISKQTLFLILAISFFAFHMLLHIIEFIKIHNLKSGENSALTWDKIKSKAKGLLMSMLSPQNSIINGFKSWLHDLVNGIGKDDEKNDGGDNG